MPVGSLTPATSYTDADAVAAAKADGDIADAISEKHAQDTDQGLDTGGASASTAADVKDAVDSEHAQGTDQGLDTGGPSAVTAAEAKSAFDSKHTQDTDQALDTGGVNEVTAAQVKSAIDLSHTQGTDQGLDTGGPNAVTAAQAKNASDFSHAQDTDQGLDTGGPSAVTAAEVKSSVNHSLGNGSDHADVSSNSASISALGTASSADIGSSTGDVPVLEDINGSPGLPAVDGSQLTGLDRCIYEVSYPFDESESWTKTENPPDSTVTVSGGVVTLYHKDNGEATLPEYFSTDYETGGFLCELTGYIDRTSDLNDTRIGIGLKDAQGSLKYLRFDFIRNNVGQNQVLASSAAWWNATNVAFSAGWARIRYCQNVATYWYCDNALESPPDEDEWILADRREVLTTNALRGVKPYLKGFSTDGSNSAEGTVQSVTYSSIRWL